MIGRFLADRSGSPSVEYAMLAGVISIVVVAGATGIGSKLNRLLLGPLLGGLR